MTNALAQIATWLAAPANALGRFLLAPVGLVPGWLSATIVAAITGVLLLAVFKYTSAQGAIQRVRDDIDANLLSLKLFKDSAPVSLRAQGRILQGACRLFVLAVVPMLIMAVPVTLLLGQLALWYQARPLRVGEDTVITLKLNSDEGPTWPATVRAGALERLSRSDGRAGPRAEPARGLLERQGPRVRQPSPGVPGRRPDRFEGAGDRRRSDAGQHPTAGLGLVGHPAEPLGGASCPTARSGRSRSTILNALRGPAARTRGSFTGSLCPW